MRGPPVSDLQDKKFSWTTQRGKHCWHPIAVMGVVDTFGQKLLLDFLILCKYISRLKLFSISFMIIYMNVSKVQIFYEGHTNGVGDGPIFLRPSHNIEL